MAYVICIYMSRNDQPKCRSENRVFVKSHTGKMRRCSDFAIPSSDHFRFSTRNFLLEVKTQSPLESCWKISVNNRRQGFHAMGHDQKRISQKFASMGPHPGTPDIFWTGPYHYRPSDARTEVPPPVSPDLGSRYLQAESASREKSGWRFPWWRLGIPHDLKNFHIAKSPNDIRFDTKFLMSFEGYFIFGKGFTGNAHQRRYRSEGIITESP